MPLRAHGFVIIKEVNDGVSISPLRCELNMGMNQKKKNNPAENVRERSMPDAAEGRAAGSTRHVNVRTYILLPGDAESQLRICHQLLVMSTFFHCGGFHHH